MSYTNPIPSTPRVISPSPTPSEPESEGYFTRSVARKTQRAKSPQPDTIHEAEDHDSDSSLEKRARTRSRSPILVSTTGRRRMSGLTPRTSSSTIPNSKTNGNGNTLPPQTNGHLSPYITYGDRLKKSWRDFSRSPSPLGLIPLHRHYRTLIHKHEIPRKALHVSIGFLTLNLYARGFQTSNIHPYLLALFIPIATVDLLRHRSPDFNRIYIKYLGALMRETEVDGYNGVIWYLLGAWIAQRFYPKDVAVMAILLLSWCDTAASTFGRLYGRYTIRLRKGKSLAGSLAAMVTGICAAWFFWGWYAPRVSQTVDGAMEGFMFSGVLKVPDGLVDVVGKGEISGNLALGVMSIATGLIASFSEFVDVFQWDDNLTIPLISSAGLWLFLKVAG